MEDTNKNQHHRSTKNTSALGTSCLIGLRCQHARGEESKEVHGEGQVDGGASEIKKYPPSNNHGSCQESSGRLFSFWGTPLCTSMIVGKRVNKQIKQRRTKTHTHRKKILNNKKKSALGFLVTSCNRLGCCNAPPAERFSLFGGVVKNPA